MDIAAHPFQMCGSKKHHIIYLSCCKLEIMRTNDLQSIKFSINRYISIQSHPNVFVKIHKY